MQGAFLALLKENTGVLDGLYPVKGYAHLAPDYLHGFCQVEWESGKLVG